MSSKGPILVWFRRNLQLEDNVVLKTAVLRGGPVIPVFIEEAPSSSSGAAPQSGRAASRWWLGRSLEDLGRDLAARGSRLILRRGIPSQVLRALIKETGASAVLWDRSFEPAQRKADDAIRKKITRMGIFCDALNDALLFEPAKILNKQGTPFKVFTPFWNHCLSLDEPAPPAPAVKLAAPSRWPRSETIKTLGLKVRAKWISKLEPFWDPGAQGALAALRKFLKKKIEDYPVARDRPATDGTSRLSPHLHFGEISPRQVWHKVRKHMASDRRPGGLRASEAFLRQLVWREFAAYQIFHFPETVSKPLRKEFLEFKWKKDATLLRAWQKGMTGYPLVDAGMRQLWRTGWMHNRVRMIVASFLVKDLLQPWQDGAAWFMDTLVDADLANNTFGWQWVAGCGADAAPYFRIFNPVLQGEKFDPQGDYVRRWVPELSKVPARFIHSPWRAPSGILEKAGVRPGRDYPTPIVDHDDARKRALFTYERMRKNPAKTRS
jgi:deoxyribodipyrimidine photo-lyase